MEGIYVIQLSSGMIKVGRSSNIGERLRTHEGNYRLLDVPIVQVWSCPVANSAVAERRILAALERVTDVDLRRGREVFRMGFLEAVALAWDVCHNFDRPVDPEVDDPNAWSRPCETPTILAHILEAFPEGETKISSRQLVAILAQRPEYDDDLDGMKLHRLIRPYNLRSRQLGPIDGAANRQGYRLQDVQAAIDDAVRGNGAAP